MTNWSPNQQVGKAYDEAIKGTLVGHLIGPVAFYLDPQDPQILCLHHVPTSKIIRVPLGSLESPSHLVCLALPYLDTLES